MKLNKIPTYLNSISTKIKTTTHKPRTSEPTAENERHSSSNNTAPSINNAREPQEQQLFVLRMLADKKISIKEAQGLLDALEGETEFASDAQYL